MKRYLVSGLIICIFTFTYVVSNQASLKSDESGALTALIENVPQHSDQSEAAHIPEPATMLLFGAGLAGMAGIVKRKRNYS